MMKKLRVPAFLLGLFVLFIAFPGRIAAGDLVTGADVVPDLYSPALAGSGAFVTSQGGAPASAVNPASGADAQRLVFDAGYLSIPGKEPGDDLKFGHVFDLGALFPTRLAAFGGSVRFLQSPFDNSFPMGTSFGGNLFAAKELYPGISLGLGLNLGAGKYTTVSGDLGLRWEVGNLMDNSVGFLGNFTWAAVLRSLGMSKAPTAFTPVGGVSFDLLHFYSPGKPDPFSFNFSADMGFPGFQNFTGKIGARITVVEMITVTASTVFNVKELLEKTTPPSVPSLIPSVGINVNFALKSGGERIVGGALPSDGDLSIAGAFKPLYKDIYAVGAGVTWYVGVADKKPPVIEVDYPETLYISPNHDGRADYLEFPISITDQRYVMEWALEISNENSDVIRTIRNKEIRPETQTVRNILTRLTVVKSGVDIPDRLRWDGVQEDGSIVPDGRYFFVISAKDDNGNAARSSRYEVIVDNTPPEVEITPIEDNLKVFSPGAGTRDTIAIYLTGSVEDLWDGGIYNADGEQVRTFTSTSSRPENVVWDGKTDAGELAPDGVYSYRISATDRAQNTGGASLENIVLDTRKAGAFLTSSVTAIAPRPGPNSDPVRFGIILSLQEGIADWTLEVQDSTGAAFRTFGGPGWPHVPPASISWNGMDENGEVREGVYTAQLTVNYTRGDSITARAAPVTVDISGPVLALNYVPEYFSPDNDGVDDELYLYMSAQDVSPIASWSLEIREPESNLLFHRIGSRGSPPETILWDGHSSKGELVQSAQDYPYIFRAEDTLGNASTLEGKIGVDILVIRDGDRLKMQVSAIIFKPDTASLDGNKSEDRENNLRILRRVAEVLNKFRDYKVQVEGHANPVEGTQREETQELKPLSDRRARAVMDQLISYGVSRSRLSSIGMGGAHTIVPYTDLDNRWKNRRVEFILIK